MENKYQKAFNEVKEHITSRHHWWSTQDERNYLATLQELVDKETPIKVDMKDNKKIKCDKFLITLVTYYKCPNKKCEFHNNHNILEGKKRCDECGQKLDWSDTYE